MPHTQVVKTQLDDLTLAKTPYSHSCVLPRILFLLGRIYGPLLHKQYIMHAVVVNGVSRTSRKFGFCWHCAWLAVKVWVEDLRT